MLKKLGKAVFGVGASAVVALGEVAAISFAAGVDAARVIRKADEIIEHDMQGLPPPADDVKPGSAISAMWKAFGVFYDDIYETFFR